MRELRLLIILGLIAVFLFGCSNDGDIVETAESAEPETEEMLDTNEIQATTETTFALVESTETIEVSIEDCNDVFECLSNAGFNLVYTIIYDETNDPNGTGEQPYIQKGSFVDGRIVGSYTDSSSLSGTVEFFASPDEARARAEDLNASTFQVYAVQILSGDCLLRLGYEYSEEEIQIAVDCINGELFSNLNSSSYTTLESTCEIGDISFPISDKWDVEKDRNCIYIYPKDSNGWITISYDSSKKITSKYLKFIEGFVDGLDGQFISAEVVATEWGTEAIQCLAKTEISGRDYYTTAYAFDGSKGHYGFVLTEPIATSDKIEMYFDDLIAGIAHIESQN